MKLLGSIVAAALLLTVQEASARPRDRDHRGGGHRRPDAVHRPVHRPVARPVHRPAHRPVARPRVRDHRGAVDVRWPRYTWGWWGPYYRRPYDRSYWPYGYYDRVYYPYPVSAATYATAAPGRPQVGIGVSLSRFEGTDDITDGNGLGGAVRWRGELVELELELAALDHPDGDRRDARFGGNVYANLTRPRVVVPYLVGGLGVNRVDHDVAPNVQQAYLAGGAGLAFPLGDAMTLSGDVRWHARWTIDDDDDARRDLQAAGTPDRFDDDERLLEARFGVMIYF